MTAALDQQRIATIDRQRVDESLAALEPTADLALLKRRAELRALLLHPPNR